MSIEMKKIGDEHIENVPYTPEKPVRIINKEGLVEYGIDIQNCVAEQAGRVQRDARAALGHIIGKSPENIALMTRLGVDKKLEKTDQRIDQLVITTQDDIATIAEGRVDI
ncbi:MAG: hypothetical protein WAV46_00150 [Candidatus Moraniibacteriota bacterium]